MKHGKIAKSRDYVLLGVLTVIPIWVTWFVVLLVLDFLIAIGKPVVHFVEGVADGMFPSIADWMRLPAVQTGMAILFVAMALFLIGWTASRVIGRKIISMFDNLIERIPMIQTIYGSVKKLVSALQKKPDNIERVVLINFPSREMKTVGLVTRTLKDEDTNRDLVAVYVPTTPNPTSGYLEIVPAEACVSTDWTVDEAMAFVISGGAVAPDSMHYTNGIKKS